VKFSRVGFFLKGDQVVFGESPSKLPFRAASTANGKPNTKADKVIKRTQHSFGLHLRHFDAIVGAPY
jgi:hypothetical protein